MASDVRLEDLKPQLVIVPYKLAAGIAAETIVAAVAGRWEKLVSTNPATSGLRKEVRGVTVMKTWAEGGWILTGVHYVLERPPAWLRRYRQPPKSGEDSDEPLLLNRTHHLALFAVQEGLAAIHATEDAPASNLQSWLADGRVGDSFSASAPIELVERDVLERTFIKGTAKQLWMQGIHQPTTLKPDRKIFFGRDLRDAIDSYGDQTFDPSGAISDLMGDGKQPDAEVLADGEDWRPPRRVGLVFEERRVWTTPTASFEGFRRSLGDLFNRIRATEGQPVVGNEGRSQHGYRLLAQSRPSRELAGAQDPIEVYLGAAAEEALRVSAYGDHERDLEERWLESGRVELARQGPGAEFSMGVFLDDEHLLDLAVRPVPIGDDRVGFQVAAEAYHVPIDDRRVVLFDELQRDIDRRLSVWYATGQVIQSGRLFKPEWRDVPFDSWRWWSFGDKAAFYDVTKEKPKAGLGAIGSEDSLFDFVVQTAATWFDPQGDWLAICDDAAGEIADFILIEPGRRRLWLIHAKGAFSGSEKRLIAVAPYEQVVSQAKKNVRFFDAVALSKELGLRVAAITPDKPGPPCWRNGAPSDAKTALDEAIAFLDSNPALREPTAVVLQPHVHELALADAESAQEKNPGGSISAMLLLRLKSLLADTEITFERIGVRFLVFGDKTPRTPKAGKAPKVARAVKKRAKAVRTP